MRASETGETGSVGQDMVGVQFKKLHWGVAPNPTDQDLGTDLWLMARDPRRFDLGALVGVQVKSGVSAFRRPEHNDAGERTGWWYAESDLRHFKYWTEHRVPHILVLHDPDTEISYWVHITREAVVPTGLGAKILVPKINVVGEGALDQLLEVSAVSSSLPRWEGSAWNTNHLIAGEDRLRHALILPRLIAPHPNLTVSSLDPAEAIALLTKMRLSDLDPRRWRETKAPVIQECLESEDWNWRFYAVMYQLLTESAEVEKLLQLLEETPEPFQLAAAVAAGAAIYMEVGRPADAIEATAKVLDADLCSPVDHAWIGVHHARALLEIGDLSGAQKAAIEVQSLRYRFDDDPTAMAIVGAAAGLIFTASAWESQKIPDAIMGRDTLGAWWRTQEVAWGLQHLADENFEKWAQKPGSRSGSSDETWLRLRSASLIAGFTGDHRAWASTVSDLAQRMLSTDSSAESATAALKILRLAGDDKAIKLAVRQLLRDGPTSAVKEAIAEFVFTNSTRSTIRSDIALIEFAADILGEQAADDYLDWALEVIRNPEPLAIRLDVTFVLQIALLDMVAAVIPALSAAGISTIVHHILNLPRLEDQSMAHYYAKVLRALPGLAFTPDEIGSLKARADDNFEFANAVLATVASRENGFRQGLQEKISSGDLNALAAYGDIRELETETVASLVSHLVAKIDDEIANLQAGRSATRTFSYADNLILVNVAHPSLAEWDAVVNFFTTVSPFTRHLEQPLEALARFGHQLPQSVKDQLEPVLRNLIEADDHEDSFFGDYGPKGHATLALAFVSPETISEADLWAYMAGNKYERAAAAAIVGHSTDAAAVQGLALIAHDRDPWVRAMIANALARIAAEGNDSAFDVLKGLVLEPGTLVSRMIAARLEHDRPTPASDELAEILRSHESAKVRASVSAYDRQQLEI